MTNPLHLPVHHLGYSVTSLEAAIPEFVSRYGAGPFFRIEHVPLEGISSRGEPGAYDHSSAFGACGDAFFELLELHEVAPERARAAFDLEPPALHHVAHVVPSLDEGIAALEAVDVPELLRANLGDISFVYLDARPATGHHVELLADVPAFHGFFSVIREAAQGWDGKTEPIRAMGG
jgi:hypothetical protein